MDGPQNIIKWKRKSNLSENRKSKRYRSSHGQQCFCDVTHSVENILPEQSSAAVQTQHILNCCSPQTDLPLTTPKCTKTTSIQVHPVTKDKKLQCACHVQLENCGTQTKNSSVPVHSTCTQTNVEDPEPNTVCGDNNINKLLASGTFGTFVDKLQTSNQTNGFINLVKSISLGALPTDNIAWKCVPVPIACAMIVSTHISLAFFRCCLLLLSPQYSEALHILVKYFVN